MSEDKYIHEETRHRIAIGVLTFILGFAVCFLLLRLLPAATRVSQSDSSNTVSEAQKQAESQNNTTLDNNLLTKDNQSVRIFDGNIEVFDGENWETIAPVETMQGQDPFVLASASLQELENTLLAEKAAEMGETSEEAAASDDAADTSTTDTTKKSSSRIGVGTIFLQALTEVGTPKKAVVPKKQNNTAGQNQTTNQTQTTVDATTPTAGGTSQPSSGGSSQPSGGGSSQPSGGGSSEPSGGGSSEPSGGGASEPSGGGGSASTPSTGDGEDMGWSGDVE